MELNSRHWAAIWTALDRDNRTSSLSRKIEPPFRANPQTLGLG